MYISDTSAICNKVINTKLHNNALTITKLPTPARGYNKLKYK